VFDALSADARAITDDDGETVAWRWQVDGGVPVALKPVDAQNDETEDAPDWLMRTAPPAPRALRTLTPSKAGGYDDEDIDTVAVGDDPLSGLAPDRRGLLIHRLLERLPGIGHDRWHKVAEAYLHGAMPEIAPQNRAFLMEEVCAVLKSPQTQFLFEDGSSQAEVTVAGTVMIGGEPVEVRGQIDRLIVVDGTLHIVDFKTNRHVPDTRDAVPHNYVRQLALYRALMAPLYPDHAVKASILWTRTAVVMAVPEAMLDAALDRLIA
ncbi:MAG: PD-(D/E)XK nuclease family protein, partial [Pseudomonadota bacterium]